MVRYSCLALLVLVAMTATPVAQSPPQCGDPIDALEAWPGIPARSNEDQNESSCAGLGRDGYQFQCVELIRRFFRQAKGVDTSVRDWCCDGADGKAFFTRAEAGRLNQGSFVFEPFRNGVATSPPAVEDIIGFDATTTPRNVHGHVALVKRVSARPDGALDVEIIEQNVSPSAGRVLRADRRQDGTYLLTGRQSIQGWIRLTTEPSQLSIELSGGVFTPSQGTAFAFNPLAGGLGVSRIEIAGPATWNAGQPFVIPNVRFQPPGIARERALWWQFVAPVSGSYTARATVGAQISQKDFTVALAPQLAAPVITNLTVNADNLVSMTWTAPNDARSFMVRVNQIPWPGFAIQDIIVGGSTRHFAFTGLPLTSGQQYQTVVFAFSHDVRRPDPLTSPFNVSGDDMFFTAR